MRDDESVLDDVTDGEQREIRQFLLEHSLGDGDLVPVSQLPKWFGEFTNLRKKFDELDKRYGNYRKEILASFNLERHMRVTAERKSSKYYEALQIIFAHAGIDWFSEWDPPVSELINKIREWKEDESTDNQGS